MHRGSPLPAIAEWIASLFEGIDITPSDLTTALVLVAAAQHRRRKMQIEQKLVAMTPPTTTSGSDGGAAGVTMQGDILPEMGVDEMIRD